MSAAHSEPPVEESPVRRAVRLSALFMTAALFVEAAGLIVYGSRCDAVTPGGGGGCGAAFVEFFVFVPFLAAGHPEALVPVVWTVVLAGTMSAVVRLLGTRRHRAWTTFVATLVLAVVAAFLVPASPCTIDL